MKRIILMLLAMALCFSICGCQEEAPKIQEPVQFYYRRAVPVYGTSDGVIAPVTVEGAGKMEDPQALLNAYLLGTAQEGFAPTFPAGTSLLSMRIADGTAELEMDPAFASLSGMELTIACACLTLTTIDLTGVSSVRISAGNATLDGAPQIVMDRNCLTLLDLYVPETTGNI